MLQTDLLREPVKVASIELLRSGKSFCCATRSTAGVEAITVPHPGWTTVTCPILLKKIIPVFVGRDAASSIATLGRLPARRQLQVARARLLGRRGRHRDRPARPAGPHCRSAGRRPVRRGGGATSPFTCQRHPRQSARGGDRLPAEARRRVGREGAQVPARRPDEPERRLAPRPHRGAHPAGARDVRRPDDPLRRFQQLVRREGGDPRRPADGGVRLRLLRGALPVRRSVEHQGRRRRPAIPVAGGEQEFSLRRFHWTIADRGLDIVQPDLHYDGGFIRATQGRPHGRRRRHAVVPHMSGGGLGYLDVVHFASFTPTSARSWSSRGTPTCRSSAPPRR